MRTIKFRVWDKENKKMRYEDDQILITLERGLTYLEKGCPDENGRDGGDFLCDNEAKDLIPMQFTGLKDRNQKEMYEGDIVQTANGYYVLVYIEEFAAFYYETIKGELHDKVSMYRRSNEVIGNIYENPELMKVKR